MPFKPLFTAIILVGCSCHNNARSSATEKNPPKTTVKHSLHDNPFAHIGDIPLPEGFTRDFAAVSSFTYFLRKVELKKDKTVHLYNGFPKTNQFAQFAVLNITVGNNDLQQCADAVMRLRAEYLFASGKYEQIIFKDNRGTAYPFSAPYSRDYFNSYLQRVFGMCGSASLAKTLNRAEFSDIRPGDVLIRGGFPGHAEMVMDVAVNEWGKKIFMLAQSYMPAQDIHVLVNPANKDLSPWYEVNVNRLVPTPEYLFYSNELKRW